MMVMDASARRAILDPPTRTTAPPVLYPHQKEALEVALHTLRETGGFYVQHDPGMGKTLTAILTARLLDCRRVLVITTKAGLGVWRAEVARWWPDAPAAVIILNYDALSSERVKLLLSCGGWDLLILDEAQYAKNPRAQRARTCQKLAKGARYKLLLSGTPAHSPLDYHAQYRLLAPQTWPWNLSPSQYRTEISNLTGPFNNWVDKRKPFKPEKVAQVERAMRPLTHKARKEELALPEPIETIVPISLSPAEQRVYAEMEKKLLVELAEDRVSDAPIVLTKILRLQQITSGFLRSTDGVDVTIGTSKIDACMDLLEERRDEKVVVAYRFGWEAKKLAERLNAGNTSFAILDGSTSDRARTSIVGMFQEGRTDVLLLQYQAGGTAITLTAADAMIFLSMTPSVIEWEQIKARIHRIGTTTHVQYLYPLAEGSIDFDLLDGLKAKADLVALTSLLRRRLA